MENALSILIVIFLHNSNKPKRQTESNLFADLAIGDIATQIADIAAPNDDVATSSANILKRRVLECFMMFYKCFMTHLEFVFQEQNYSWLQLGRS